MNTDDVTIDALKKMVKAKNGSSQQSGGAGKRRRTKEGLTRTPSKNAAVLESADIFQLRGQEKHQY